MKFNAPTKLFVAISVILALVSVVQFFSGTIFLGLKLLGYAWACLAWAVLFLGVVLKGS